MNLKKPLWFFSPKSSSKESPADREFVVCETTAAITTHIRDCTKIKVNLGGLSGRPGTLCGMVAAWDTLLPLEYARCTKCVAAWEKLKCQTTKTS